MNRNKSRSPMKYLYTSLLLNLDIDLIYTKISYFNSNYYIVSIDCIFIEITFYNITFTSFSVRPDKPIIKILETEESVEGYLGPYQIGTSLSLVCQVNGGK